jgi:hypothetical protein
VLYKEQFSASYRALCIGVTLCSEQYYINSNAFVHFPSGIQPATLSFCCNPRNQLKRKLANQGKPLLHQSNLGLIYSRGKQVFSKVCYTYILFTCTFGPEKSVFFLTKSRSSYRAGLDAQICHIFYMQMLTQ